MAVAVSMHVPQGAEVSTEEDDLDLRWLEDRLTWAGRLGDAAQSLRDCESDAEFSDDIERWLSLEETAKLRCEKRRETMKLEKLEKRMHLVSSSCVEAQSHLASLKRERDLLKDCVQELLVLAQPGRSAEVAARRQRSPEMPVAKGAAASLAPPVAQTPQGPTPRSARSGAGTVTPNVLTVRRHVRFDDKLMESPREPRVPLPAGQVWQHVPILKHRPTEPVTQEPTSLDAQDPGTARRSPSPPTARIEGAEAPRVMDSARMASGEPMVRQEAQEAHGGLQLPRWAHASPPAAPQLIHVAPQVPGRLQPMTGQVVQPLQPWLIRTQPSPGMPQGRGYGAPPVPIRRVVQRS